VKASDSGPGFLTQHRFALLFVTQLVFFLTVPLVHEVREALHPGTPPFLEALLFIAVLAGVTISLSASRVSKMVALGLGVPTALFIVLHFFDESTWMRAVRHLCGLVYSILDHLNPAALRTSIRTDESAFLLRIGSGRSTAVLYFSFATLTTLGYCDIVPVSPLARTLATLEAITGQLYLAVLVARLVGIHIAESLEKK
jgi:hypothetical protein